MAGWRVNQKTEKKTDEKRREKEKKLERRLEIALWIARMPLKTIFDFRWEKYRQLFAK